MKKAMRSIAVVVSIAVLLLTSLPQIYAVTGYKTGVVLQNLSSTSQTSYFIAYARQSNGYVKSAYRSTVPPLASSLVYPLIDAESGFDGSTIVEASQPVAMTVGVVGNNGNSAAAYTALKNGNNTVIVPLLMKGNYGYNTWMRVQNLGTSSTNVNISYSDQTSNSFGNLMPGGAATFYQAQEYHPVSVFGATVSGSQPLGVAVIEDDASTMFAYTGFNSGSTYPVMPLINSNNYGFITGVQISNNSASATYVIVTYTPSTAGTTCYEGQWIQPGGSNTFALNVFSYPPGSNISTTCQLGFTFVGSARVTQNTASAPLAVIVNQLNTSDGKGEAYGAFNPFQATNIVNMPLISDRAAIFGGSSYSSGFSVMNVGGNASQVDCSFTSSGYTTGAYLQPGQTLINTQNGHMTPNYVGAARCISQSAPIIGIVNSLGDNSPLKDNFMVYEAVNSQ